MVKIAPFPPFSWVKIGTVGKYPILPSPFHLFFIPHIPTFKFYPALYDNLYSSITFPPVIHPSFLPSCSIQLFMLSSPITFPPVIHPSTFLPSCSIQLFMLSSPLPFHLLFIPPHSYLPVLSSSSCYPPHYLSTCYSSLHIPTFLFYLALHAILPITFPPVIHPPHSYLPVLSSSSCYPPHYLSTCYSSLHIPTFLFYLALHAILPITFPPVIHPSTFLPSCSI